MFRWRGGPVIAECPMEQGLRSSQQPRDRALQRSLRPAMAAWNSASCSWGGTGWRPGRTRSTGCRSFQLTGTYVSAAAGSEAAR